jgi:cell division protein FtsB
MVMPEAYAKLVAHLDVLGELIQAQIDVIMSIEAGQRALEQQVAQLKNRVAELEETIAALKGKND